MVVDMDFPLGNGVVLQDPGRKVWEGFAQWHLKNRGEGKGTGGVFDVKVGVAVGEKTGVEVGVPSQRGYIFRTGP